MALSFMEKMGHQGCVLLLHLLGPAGQLAAQDGDCQELLSAAGHQNCRQAALYPVLLLHDDVPGICGAQQDRLSADCSGITAKGLLGRSKVSCHATPCRPMTQLQQHLHAILVFNLVSDACRIGQVYTSERLCANPSHLER